MLTSAVGHPSSSASAPSCTRVSMWGSVQGSSGSLQTGLHQPGVPWLSPGPPCPASQITPPAPHHSKAPHPMVPAHCCLPRRMRVAILLDATQSVPPRPPQQKGAAHRGARPGATARPHCPSCHVGVQSPACPGGEISPNLPMPTTSVSLRRGGGGGGNWHSTAPPAQPGPLPQPDPPPPPPHHRPLQVGAEHQESERNLCPSPASAGTAPCMPRQPGFPPSKEHRQAARGSPPFRGAEGHCQAGSEESRAGLCLY